MVPYSDFEPNISDIDAGIHDDKAKEARRKGDTENAAYHRAMASFCRYRAARERREQSEHQMYMKHLMHKDRDACTKTSSIGGSYSPPEEIGESVLTTVIGFILFVAMFGPVAACYGALAGLVVGVVIGFSKTGVIVCVITGAVLAFIWVVLRLLLE